MRWQGLVPGRQGSRHCGARQLVPQRERLLPLRHAVLCSATPCVVALHHAVPCRAVLCCVALRCALT